MEEALCLIGLLLGGEAGSRAAMLAVPDKSSVSNESVDIWAKKSVDSGCPVL
jgi:gas vesicle protein